MVRAVPGTFVPLVGTKVPKLLSLSEVLDDDGHRFPARQHHLRGPLRALGARQLAGHGARLQPRTSAQWQSDFSDFERKAALWNYALFFWGEDAVADGLSPYVDAAPLEEQKYFLATQQVDEARHAVFFKRFMDEVAGIGGTTGEALEAIRPQLTWGFVQVFDRLERDVRRAPAATARSRSSRRRSRSTTWSSRPRWPSRASTSSPATWTSASVLPGLPRGHGERGAGRAAPHRLRREDAARPAGRWTPTGARTPWPTCCAR